MTRVVKDDKFIPVTLLQVSEMRVVGFKTAEKDGYDAIIVGVLADKAEGTLKKDKTTLSKNEFSSIAEFAVSGEYKVWDVIGLDNLDGVTTVRVEGFSKGKGFTGAMKKHNFHGGPASHGSKFHRALGSIGNRKPTRTHKGKKMHGHHGDIKVSLKSVPLEIVNKDLGVIGVRGGVPGGRNSIVNIIF